MPWGYIKVPEKPKKPYIGIDMAKEGEERTILFCPRMMGKSWLAKELKKIPIEDRLNYIRSLIK